MVYLRRGKIVEAGFLILDLTIYHDPYYPKSGEDKIADV